MTGRYGRAFLESLEASKPHLYGKMSLQERSAAAAEVNERAERQASDLLEQMLAANPGPSDSLGKMAHVASLQRRAQEIVMDEAVVKEEPEPDPATSPAA